MGRGVRGHHRFCLPPFGTPSWRRLGGQSCWAQCGQKLGPNRPGPAIGLETPQSSWYPRACRGGNLGPTQWTLWGLSPREGGVQCVPFHMPLRPPQPKAFSGLASAGSGPWCALGYWEPQAGAIYNSLSFTGPESSSFFFFFWRGEGRGPHQAVLRADSWLYTQESLLVGLGTIWDAGDQAQSAVWKVNALLSVLSVWTIFSLFLSNLSSAQGSLLAVLWGPYGMAGIESGLATSNARALQTVFLLWPCGSAIFPMAHGWQVEPLQ